MKRDFIYKLAQTLSEDLNKIADLIKTGKSKMTTIVETIPKGEAREMARKHMYKTIAALGLPTAYLIGRSSGKNKQLQDIMYPQQKQGSEEANESTLIKLGALFIQRLADENKELNEKLAAYDTKDKAIKIAVEMIEKGIIGTNQLNSKISELVKNGAANMVVVMEKANKDILLSESDSNQNSTTSGISEFETYLLN